MQGTNAELFAVVHAWVAANYVGDAPTVLRLTLWSGREVSLPVPVAVAVPATAPASHPFVPNGLQGDVLAALEGKALRTDALANAAGCDRRTLFRNPGGLKELQDRGLVKNHPRVGYYRPDAPPPELREEGG